MPEVFMAERVDILFRDLRGGEKQAAQIGNGHAFTILSAERNLVKVVIMDLRIERFTFNRGRQMFIHFLRRTACRYRQVHPARRGDVAQNVMAGDQAHLCIIFRHD